MKPNYIRTDSKATIVNYNSDLSYDYDQSDAIVEFAKDHSMKVVGHTLWYDPNNVPKFVIDLNNRGSLSASIMSNIVRDHITNVITHFNSSAPGTVYAWQVTNEALDDDGNVKTNQIVHRILGDSSFSNLYRYAQDVITPITPTMNRNTKLFYNDFTNLSDNRIFGRLKDLKDVGILDGIGMQCHETASNILEAMTLKYVQEGFEVHFTEIDNASNITDAELRRWYENVIDIALKYGVRNFTVWGLIDSSSWLHNTNSEGVPYSGGSKRYPLLFNPSFQPKSCYTGLVEKLKAFGDQIYDIIIIIGQSNSVGYASNEYTFDNPEGVTYSMRDAKYLSNYTDDFDNKFDENIRTFTTDNRIVPAFEQLDSGNGVGRRGKYGFGLSFARQYIKEGKLIDGRKILLINRGFGGTGFFNVGSRWNHYLDNNLYDKAINSIKMAKSAIHSSSEVKAILWHQGEADVSGIFDSSVRNSSNNLTRFGEISANFKLSTRASYTEDEAKDLYSRSLTTMLTTLKSEIAASSATQILLGGLCPSMYIDHNISGSEKPSNERGSYKNFPYTNYPLMNQLILSIARNNGYKFVSAEQISLVSPHFNHYLKSNDGGDIIHFNKSSQIELGKRYFYVYNNSIRLNSATFNTTFNNDVYDVFVILGQSNSVGRGLTEYTFDNPSGVTYNMESYSFYNNDFNNTEDNKIKCFNERKFSDPQIINGTEPIEALGGPKVLNEYGFGMSFARQYIKENSTKKVLLINCGWGGTSIGAWAINSGTKIGTGLGFSNHTHEGKNLYQASLARIRSALSQINISSTVKAILWHQGESDIGNIFGGGTTDLSDSEEISNKTEYTNNLTSMLNSLRTNIASPTTPILLGGLCPSHYVRHRQSSSVFSENAGPKYKRMNDEVISQICRDNSGSYYKFVSSDPINVAAVNPHFNHYLKGNSGDDTHFSKSSQIEFGKRYFYVYNGNRITF